MLIKILLPVLLIAGACEYSSAQYVAKNIHQLLSSDEKNPKTLFIKLHTDKFELKRTVGSRVRVSGKVKISIPNLLFLEHLIDIGRYSLTLSPDGEGRIRLEDSYRKEIVFKKTECREIVTYTLYLPEQITQIVFENTETGDSNVIVMKD
jgi:hypothetical protein